MARAAHTTRSQIPRLAACVIACAAWCAPVSGQYITDKLPEQVEDLSLENRLGKVVPTDIELIDASGETVTLGQHFGSGKPILLTMAYYDCPVLCPMFMNLLAQAFNELGYTVGEDFDLVVVSFDPTNTPMQSFRQREEMLALIEHKASQDVTRGGLSFYTTDEENARRLADAIGFSYNYLPEIDEYAHTTALMVLSPDGVLSHVFPNLTFRNPDSAKPVRDLKLSMLKATEGEIADSIADFVLNFCYTYDPTRGAYTLEAMRLMQVVGVLTVAGLSVLIGGNRLREIRRKKRTRLERDMNEGPGVGAQPVVR